MQLFLLAYFPASITLILSSSNILPFLPASFPFPSALLLSFLSYSTSLQSSGAFPSQLPLPSILSSILLPILHHPTLLQSASAFPSLLFLPSLLSSALLPILHHYLPLPSPPVIIPLVSFVLWCSLCPCPYTLRSTLSHCLCLSFLPVLPLDFPTFLTLPLALPLFLHPLPPCTSPFPQSSPFRVLPCILSLHFTFMLFSLSLLFCVLPFTVCLPAPHRILSVPFPAYAFYYSTLHFFHLTFILLYASLPRYLPSCTSPCALLPHSDSSPFLSPPLSRATCPTLTPSRLST